MEENREIKNLDNHIKPILDKKTKRSNLILFVDNYLNYVESIPLLMSIINNGKKEHQKKIEKMSELKTKIQKDTCEFYNVLTKILKQNNLFDINDEKYKEILNIQEIKGVYLREPPYNLSDLEASMLYAFLAKKEEDWLEKYWHLRSVISSLIDNKKTDVLQNLFSTRNSDPEKLVSPFYKPYHDLWQRHFRNLGAIWNDLEKEKPYFLYYTAKQLKERIEALHYLIKIKYQNPSDVESEINPKPLPVDVKPPKIEENHFILEFEDGEKLEFKNKEDPSCEYFNLTLKRHGQITPHSLACTELKIKDTPESRKTIRGLVKTLREKIINNKLSHRITYIKPKKGKGYILNISNKLDR